MLQSVAGLAVPRTLEFAGDAIITQRATLQRLLRRDWGQHPPEPSVPETLAVSGAAGFSPW